MHFSFISCLSIICFVSMIFCLNAFSAEEIKVENIEATNGRPYMVGPDGIDIGTKYYSDRDYVVNTLPEELIGAMFIMTANDDKNCAGEDFLKFTVDRNVKIWLARDSRGDEGKGGRVPEWLSEDKGWIRHEDMKIDCTDGNMGFFILYSKDFEKGEIVLGGNTDPPSAGQGSQYLVLLTPGEKLSVESKCKVISTWAELKSIP